MLTRCNIVYKYPSRYFKIPSGKLSHNYGKSPFFMGKSTISMAIFNSYVKLPTGAELATHWFHHPSARGFPCHNNSDVLRILLLGVSFRVYISYKIRTRQKSEKDWKSGNGRSAWSPQKVHFSDRFFQKIVLDHANPQNVPESEKTLRLRREWVSHWRSYDHSGTTLSPAR